MLQRIGRVVSGGKFDNPIAPAHHNRLCLRRFGLLICDDRLVTMVQPKAVEHRITAPDILLLIDFVKATPALKSSEQNWLPLCLPNFNDKGFLQVPQHTMPSCQQGLCLDVDRRITRACVCFVSQAYVGALFAGSDLFLILISTQNDADQFHRFHSSRVAFEQVRPCSLADLTREGNLTMIGVNFSRCQSRGSRTLAGLAAAKPPSSLLR